MKFTLIVLLGLCAFATSSDIFQDIPDVEYIHLEPIVVPRLGDISFPAVVNEYMEKVTIEFNSVVENFKDISGSVRNAVTSNNEKQIKQVDEKAVIVTQDIQEFSAKGSVYAACGKQHLSEIIDITGTATLGIKECASDIAGALKVLADDILTASTTIVGDALRLKDIVLECYNKGSNLGIAKCALGHLKEFKQLATEVISKAKQSLASFKEHGQQLLDSVKKCNENYVQTTITKFQNIKKVMIECANN